MIALMHMVVHAASLPRKYCKSLERLNRIELCEELWRIETDENTFYIPFDAREADQLQQMLGEWSIGSDLEVWQSCQIQSHTFALRHHTTDTTVFATKTPFAEKTSRSIKFFQVIGERCSGTNFLQKLLGHFTQVNLTWDYGWKHFPIWFGNVEAKQWKQDTQVAFIVIVRNPYDWLKSIHRTPHHADDSLRRIPFDLFVEREWKLSPEEERLKPSCDRNPLTGDWFPNILHLRAAKLKDWLHLQTAPFCYYINYETLRDYPYAVLAELKDLFNLHSLSIFSKAVYYKNQLGRPYVKPQATTLDINERTLDFINSQLDWETECEYGYSCVTH